MYEYASWISPEFKDAVYECFTLAANGDGQGAVDAAVSVAVPQTLLDNIDHYTDMVQAAIGAWILSRVVNMVRTLTTSFGGTSSTRSALNLHLRTEDEF